MCYKNEKEWQVRVAPSFCQREEGLISIFQAVLNDEVSASLTVPYRPKLFGKMKPVVLNISASALERDEVFLLLVLIYSETRRQDRMVRP